MRSLFGSRFRGVVVGLMVLLMASLALPRGVAACSGGPSGGAREKLTISEVVVVGQATSVGFLGESEDHAAAARVTIRVDHVLKGDVPGVVSYVDRASFISWPGGVDHTPENATYGGGGGACGTLNANPEGKYVLALFSRLDDGTLTTSRTYMDFVDEPGQLTAVLERYGLPVQLPATGAGGYASAHGRLRAFNGLAFLAITVLAVGASRFRWK